MNVICAYTVNIDAVFNVMEEKIAEFALSASAPATEIELRESIGTPGDLISSLLFCMRNGSGAEILIEGQELARQIEAAFPWQFRLGGNAGITANVLAALGARPVLNAPGLGPRLAGMLHPQVSIPVSGELKNPVQAAEMAGTGPEMVHFVFQFKEGDTAASAEGRIAAPRDNRFIATFDPINTRLVSSRHFDSYCQENIQSFDGAILSGFHLASLESYQDIFSERIAQIRSWKEKNPEVFIHAEMGSFQSPLIARYLLSRLPIDSLGMNEDEVAAAEGKTPGCWQETVQAAQELRERLGLFRVAVHTRDYILSVILDAKITAEEEITALQSGADAAAALAATGYVAGEPPEEVNSAGLLAREEFCRSGAEAAGRGAFLDSGGEIVSLMPSLLAREPRITVGLGDTATATIFLEELKAIKGERS